MALKKYVKKVAKKAGGMVKKRYFKGAGYSRPNLATMVRDLALVKRSLNVEKKHIQSVISNNIDIGQTNANVNSGFSVVDITPVITQGVGYDQMTGNSVKLVSMALSLQIKQQSATAHPMKVRMVIVKTRGTPVAAGTFGTNFYDVNPITGLTDFNSERNTNFFRDYQVVKSKILYLQPDPTSGEIMLNNYKVIMKMNHHLKYNQNTTTLTDGQLLVGFFCDSGNKSTTTASTLANIPVLKINSGATIQYFTKYYYVDN